MYKKIRPILIDSLLEDLWNTRHNKMPSHFAPQVGTMDVSEDDKNIYVEIDVPNYDIESIKIETQDKKMIISGNLEEEKNNRRYKIKERNFNSFSRTILFENSIEEESVSAELENGVLTIVVAKAEKKNEKKLITIKKN
jgi:HSP20 family protein